jgi:hypothetical protein
MGKIKDLYNKTKAAVMTFSGVPTNYHSAVVFPSGTPLSPTPKGMPTIYLPEPTSMSYIQDMTTGSKKAVTPTQYKDLYILA